MDERVSERFRVDEVTFTPLPVADAVEPRSVVGRTAGEFFVDALMSRGAIPKDRDILVVSSKVATSFEGGLIRLADVVPRRKARMLGRWFGKDPKKVQVLMETGRVMLVLPMERILASRRLWRMLAARSPNPEAMRRAFRANNKYVFLVQAHAAQLDDAGIDYSNAPEGYVTVLPKDPCATAARIRDAIRQRFAADVAVIVTDTVTTFGRVGSNDRAIGYAGIDPITRLTFSDDLFGVPRSGGIDLVIDSVAGMAGLVMGQTTELTPAVLVRGVRYLPERTDEEFRGMAALSYPPGTLWKAAAATVFATGLFHLANLFTFQRWPKRTRS